MAFLYGRAGRLTAQNAGFRPGQCDGTAIGSALSVTTLQTTSTAAATTMQAVGGTLEYSCDTLQYTCAASGAFEATTCAAAPACQGAGVVISQV